jgi:hypothetical protein
MALAAGLLGFRSLSDNSFFTHLETGRRILESGVPRADPYSFTAPGEPWVVQSWLASVVLALADRAAGGLGIRILAAVLIAVITGLTWRLTKPARALIPRVAVTGLVVVVSANFWSPRPLLIGLACFAALLVLFQEQRDPRWTIPIMWIWVNSHGSFPLGLVAIATYVVGARLDGKDVKQGLRFLAWTTGGILLGMVGPIGPQLLLFPVQLLGRMEILSRVLEWQSPSFSQGFVRVFLVQVVVAIVLVVRRPRYETVVPLVVFLAAALFGLRNLPVTALVLVPGMAWGLRDLGSVRGTERGRGVVLAGGAVAVVLLLVAGSFASQPSYDLSSYPVDALAWLDQNDLGPSTVRLATQDTVGNVIELVEGPDAKVFLDDRYDMYPLDLLRDYLVLHAGSPGWEKVLRDRGIDCVLWDRSEPLPQLLAESPGWIRRYQDANATVTCRRDLQPSS